MDQETNDDDTIIIVNVKVKQELIDEDYPDTHPTKRQDGLGQIMTLPKITSIQSVHIENSIENDLSVDSLEDNWQMTAINPDEVNGETFGNCPQDWENKENSIQKSNIECPHCQVRISFSDFSYHVDFCSKINHVDDKIQRNVDASTIAVKSDKKHVLIESSSKSANPSKSFVAAEISNVAKVSGSSEKLESSNNEKELDLNRNCENNLSDSKSSQECEQMDLLLWTESTLSCSKCSFTTDKQSTLIDHERKQHNTNEAIFQCFHCNQKYSRSMMATHIRNTHPNQKFQMVDENDQIINISNKNEKHRHRRMQKIRTTSKAVAKPKTLFCSQCSYTSIRPSDLAKHKRVHVKGVPMIKCEWCDFASSAAAVVAHKRFCRTRIESLGRHDKSDDANISRVKNSLVSEKNKHPDIEENSSELIKKGNIGSKTKVKCPYCCLITTHQYLKQHIVIHKRGVLNRKCNYCNFEAPGMTLLKHMMREHGKKIHKIESQSGAAPSEEKESKPEFVCYHCPYSTNFKMALHNHMKRHIRRKRKINITFPSNTKKKNRIISGPSEKLVDGESENNTALNENANLKKEQIRHVSNVSDKSPTNVKERSGPVHYCTECTFSSNIRTEIEEHICKHFPSDFMKCDLCSLVGTKDLLARHKKSHADKAVSKCSYCDFVSTKTALERHMILHRRGGTRKQCEFCSAVFYGSNHLASHKMNQPIKKCDTCEFKSTPASLAFHSFSCRIQKTIDSIMKPETQSQSVNSHIASSSSVDEPDNTAKGIFLKCKLCSAKFSKKATLLCHMRSHVNESRMGKCLHCDFRSTFTLLRKHVSKTGHFSRRKRCLKCHSFFKRTKSSMKYKCSSCSASPKKTLSKSDTTFDVENSQPSKQPNNFHCDICSFSTNLRIKLKVHIKKNHDMNIPVNSNITQNNTVKSPKKKVLLVCEKCSFSTYSPSELRKHKENGHADQKIVRSIGNVKIFHCEFCSFSTFWQYLLERHMHSHTVLKLSIGKCPNCSYRSTPAALAAHSNKCNKS